jgi:hypothetical protein
MKTQVLVRANVHIALQCLEEESSALAWVQAEGGIPRIGLPTLMSC